MSARPAKRNTDRELSRQIEAARGAETPVSATFTLKGHHDQTPLSPDETEAAVRSIVSRVEREVSCRAHGLNVFPYLQSFAIQAPSRLVERLAGQPEIATGMPSRPGEDVMIRPVERREVPAPTRSKAKRSPRKR